MKKKIPLTLLFFSFKFKHVVGKCGKNSDPYLVHQYTWCSTLYFSLIFGVHYCQQCNNLELKCVKN